MDLTFLVSQMMQITVDNVLNVLWFWGMSHILFYFLHELSLFKESTSFSRAINLASTADICVDCAEMNDITV